MNNELEVAIIGSGFSGINMGISLLKSKINSFYIFEKSSSVGGVWRDNVYPGCTCDIRAALYSLKLEANPNWSANFPKQNEIFDYQLSIVGKYGLKSKIKYKTAINSLVFDEKKGKWHIKSTSGDYIARVVVLATGPQRLPNFPTIVGFEKFKKQSFHSAKWDDSVNLTGLKVAVIGTGASCIQIVPNIQSKVGHLYLFQRTPAWILPRMQRNTFRIERTSYTYFPFLLKIKRELIFSFYELIGTAFTWNKLMHKVLTLIAKVKLWAEIKDPSTRLKLTPRYKLGCKRILVSDNFYKSLTNPNVTLVTDPIKSITEHSINTPIDNFEVDVIIWATGFTVADIESYIEITGLNGDILNDLWSKNGAQAFLGMNISGFPNLCYLLGPNSGLSHSSALHAMESQVNYVIQYLKNVFSQEQGTFLNVKPEVQHTYNDQIQAKLKGTVWDSGCTSWFLDKNNKNTVIFPGSLSNFRKLTRKFKIDNYEIKRGSKK